MFAILMSVQFFMIVVLFRIINAHQRLTAVNHSSHAFYLYQQVRNANPPPDDEPANVGAQIRELICEDITSSGVFPVIHMSPVSLVDLPKHWRQRNYINIIYQLFSFSQSEKTFVYTNAYKLREFNVADADRFSEHVFACPMVHWSNTDNAVLYYVSKEYNVSLLPHHQAYKPGRFIFGHNFANRSAEYDRVLLAEEPVIAYEPDEGFDIELYYLNLRKRVRLADTDEVDPLCKLLTADSRDAINQHYRFCVAVSTSSYFEGQFLYPMRMPHLCGVHEISFRRPEAAKKVTKSLFGHYERMTLCRSQHPDRHEDETHLYISRGYLSDQIFVYRLDPEDNRIYLENLSVNVSIVDELSSFDFPES